MSASFRNGNNSPSPPLVNEPSRQASTPNHSPLPAAEIESLLRLAQRNQRRSSDQPIDEELGPGDVLHLRGTTAIVDGDAQPHPKHPDVGSNPSQQVAEAILNSAPESQHIQGDSAEIGFSDRKSTTGGLSLDDLGDLELDISIELGRTEILIEDILKLREGSVVALDRSAGDPVDIVANGRLVARGELLVIDGKFGVRLSEVL